MWYKKDKDIIRFGKPLERIELSVLKSIFNDEIHPVGNGLLYIGYHYVGLINYHDVSLIPDDDDIVIVSKGIHIRVDEIELLFGEQDMEKVMEILQDE